MKCAWCRKEITKGIIRDINPYHDENCFKKHHAKLFNLRKCKECKGRGFVDIYKDVVVDDNWGNGIPKIENKKVSISCKSCNGEGYIKKEN